MNAKISLHKAPSTGDFKHPVNAHWSTSHLNFICDEANQYEASCMIDSKDAKCIINGELPPVLKPGKTWKSIEYPDHTFDQSRNNAVTPITHLFLQSKILPFNTPALNSANLNIPGTQTEVQVTSTGKAVTLINLSLYEPETVLRVFNEIFYLMSLPELDAFFRNPETLQVKEVFIFVVDNGPSEAPASTIIQMLLARLVKFLNLDKAVQRSFAEYLSKRNFVERCHAAENKGLERHEPFSSKQINPSAVPGTDAHKENMEKMATDVRAAIDGTMFNKEPTRCFRGVGDRLVFNDEEGLKYFSSLCNDRKELCDMHYSAVNNGIYGYLVQNWGVEENFTGNYADDYRSLKSDASRCKYSVLVYRQDDKWRGKMQEKFEREPIPDLLRFEHTRAMHYLPYEVRRDLPVGEWDGITQLFLPSDILDLAQKVFYPKPSQDILSTTAFLAWIPRHQAEEFYTCGSKDAELLAEEDNSKEFWSKHSLLIKNTREELVAICSSKKLLETGKKHELVERIVKATEGESSWKGSCDIYSRSLSQVPSSVAQLNKQPVRFLRAVLRFHGFCPLGTKDELIIRVGLLKGGQIQTAFSRERMELVKRISILRDIYKLLDQEKETKLYVHKRRTFGSDGAVLSTRDKCGLKKVVHEDKLDVQGTVSDILDRLEQSLLKLENAAVEKIGRSVKSRKEMSPAPSKRRKYQASEEEPSRKSTREKQRPKKLEEGWVAEERELITKVGARIHVLWTENELRGTKFKPGWYEGEVQQYDDDNDVIRVLYKDEGMVASSRAKNLFDLSVTVALAEGLITLKRAKTY